MPYHAAPKGKTGRYFDLSEDCTNDPASCELSMSKQPADSPEHQRVLVVLRAKQKNASFGTLATRALSFVGNQAFELSVSEQGQSSLEVAKIQSIKLRGPNIRREAFTGVTESLEALSERDV